MRTGAGLHRDETGRLGGEEDQHVLAPEPLAEQDGSSDIGAMRPEDVLGQIQADGAHLCHGRLPPVVLNATILAR